MSLTAKAIAIAAICGLLLSALWGYGRRERLAGRAEIQAQWDADKLVRSTKALETIKEYRHVEEQRRVLSDAAAAEVQAKADRARRDAAAGAAERDRLREYADTLAAACDRPAVDPAAAAGSAPAASPGLVLADLRRRADDTAEDLATRLDLAHAAGTACERIHDRLTKGNP